VPTFTVNFRWRHLCAKQFNDLQIDKSERQVLARDVDGLDESLDFVVLGGPLDPEILQKFGNANLESSLATKKFKIKLTKKI